MLLSDFKHELSFICCLLCSVLFCSGLFCGDLLCGDLICGDLLCGDLLCGVSFVAASSVVIFSAVLYSAAVSSVVVSTAMISSTVFSYVVVSCGHLGSGADCNAEGNLRKSPDLQLRYYHRQALNNDKQLSCRPSRGARAKIQKMETTQRRLPQRRSTQSRPQ